jgi:chromosome condensin MukBEF complex kleisin-like MukF subunit
MLPRRAEMTSQNSPRSGQIDLDAAARLVDMLERDLERARQGNGDVEHIERLRADVEQLRTALAASPVPEEVHAGLHSLRDTLHAVGDELQRDAIKVGDYIARIGRLLGL